MRTIEYTVPSESDGREAAVFLKSKGYSRAIITDLKQDDRLQVNGVKARTVDIVHTGDKVMIRMEDKNEIIPNPSLTAEIAYEDEDVVVYNKPYDMPVHPSIMHYDDTLANLFIAQHEDTAFRSVSRLDRNTSGLVAVAKNKLAAAWLSGNPKYRPKKLYYAVVSGNVTEKFGCCGEIIAPIARADESIINRVVRSDGKYAHTVFKVIKSSDEMGFLEISLVTGRTHQIRVHFSHYGYPLLGDDLYGGDCTFINRQALHCGQMMFIHPISHKKIIVNADIPEDMKKLTEMIKG